MGDVLEYQGQDARLRAAVEAYAERLMSHWAPDDRAQFVAAFTEKTMRQVQHLAGSPRLHRELIRRLTQELAP